MSKEMIFQDNRCKAERCSFDSGEKLRLNEVAELHPGNVAVGVCFERTLLSGCNLKVLGEFTPENAQELRVVLTENGNKVAVQDKP